MKKTIKRINVTIYCDYGGIPLWSEPMIFNKLHAVGESMIVKSIGYTVRRVAILGNLQIVNFESAR